MVDDQRVLADLVEGGERADAQLRRPLLDSAQLVEPADVDDPVRRRDAQPEPVQQLGAPGEQRHGAVRDRLDGGCRAVGAGVREVPHRASTTSAAARTAAVICG